jgi:preprotein translocase subunit SecB
MSMNQKIVTSGFPFQLVDIRLFHVQAERHFPEEEGEEGPALRIELTKAEEPHTAPEFSLWLELESDLPSGDAPECSISLSIEGHFKTVVDPTGLKPEIVERFKRADAVLLLWPYLRETLHNLTDRMRLGVPPLPVIDARALLVQPVDEFSSEEDFFEDE